MLRIIMGVQKGKRATTDKKKFVSKQQTKTGLVIQSNQLTLKKVLNSGVDLKNVASNYNFRKSNKAKLFSNDNISQRDIFTFKRIKHKKVQQVIVDTIEAIDTIQLSDNTNIHEGLAQLDKVKKGKSKITKLLRDKQCYNNIVLSRADNELSTERFYENYDLRSENFVEDVYFGQYFNENYCGKPNLFNNISTGEYSSSLLYKQNAYLRKATKTLKKVIKGKELQVFKTYSRLKGIGYKCVEVEEKKKELTIFDKIFGWFKKLF